MTDPAAPLTVAARQRADDTRARAVDALRRLNATGEPVTYTRVAHAANVSRSWLYRQPDLRLDIDRLRTDHATATPPVPAAERATAESTRRRLEAMHDEIQRLKDENRVLREQVARRFGEQRASGRP